MGKGRVRDHTPVVEGPSPDLRIELLDERPLRGVPVAPQCLAQGVTVSLDGILPGFGVCLEAQPRAVLSAFPPRMRFADGVLPDRKAQELESDVPFMVMEGVCDSGFGGV